VKRRPYRCSFCWGEGHYWPTCPKKLRADLLMRRLVSAIIREEVARLFGSAAPLIQRAGAVTLHAYDRAGSRWSLPLSTLRLPMGRSKRRKA